MSRFRLQRKTIEPGIQFVGQQFLDSPAVQLFRFSEQTFAEFSSEADFDLIQTNIGDTDNEVTGLTCMAYTTCLWSIKLLNSLALTA
ncbi:hypothetical protein [Marinilabilia salmonicolor]|uniref:hypothetical protein n=1 Tax=Marinilabilia salmonicolor TaxID=989 RepID=UPI001F161682|nr:hypothetical protein [Marinilabilia salmonicolor]